MSFHNGQPLTSRDVAFTFQRFLELGDNPYKWLLHGVKQVLEKGPYCVELILDKPNALLPYALCDERLSILPQNRAAGKMEQGLFR